MSVKQNRSQRYLALLRGVNVGGRNILPMKTLVTIVEEAGCERVSTFIQSGNALFTGETRDETELAADLSARIEARFGFHVPIVLRTLEELRAAIGANPLVAQGVDPKNLHVYFLRDTPSPEAVATLDAARSLPDTFTLLGREIYLNLPNGTARSKLTNAYFDSKLKTVSTVRNWNTALKLLELMQAES